MSLSQASRINQGFFSIKPQGKRFSFANFLEDAKHCFSATSFCIFSLIYVIVLFTNLKTI